MEETEMDTLERDGNSPAWTAFSQRRTTPQIPCFMIFPIHLYTYFSRSPLDNPTQLVCLLVTPPSLSDHHQHRLSAVHHSWPEHSARRPWKNNTRPWRGRSTGTMFWMAELENGDQPRSELPYRSPCSKPDPWSNHQIVVVKSTGIIGLVHGRR